MKCDRNVPCGSCTKRGLSNLCLANGTLRPGKGTRYILSSTEELHTKIDQLLERARDLEVALEASYSLHSNQTHGLLKKDLLVEGSRLALERDQEEDPEVPIAALGTLKISQKTGGSEWIGSIASSYFFVQDDDAASVASSVETLPENELMLQQMVEMLPSKVDAWSLIECFYENFTWNYNPIPRTVLIRDFFTPTYDPNQPTPSVHHISVLFSVFSIGILMDLSRSPNASEAKVYRDMAKIPLDIENVSKETTVTTIEALIMYAQAIQWSDDPAGPALAWTYLCLCVTLSESIGLHRDPKSTWNMDDAITLRRRRVFWELMYMATWQCLIHGRPPLLTQRHTDVQLPEEETTESMGTDPTFHLWRYRWTKELGWPMAEKLLSPAHPPTHALVMRIDKTIREFGFPWNVDAKPESEDENVLLDFENMMMSGILELTSLHVHRGFFAHALFQSPTDPLQSKFAASVYSAFGAACRIIQRAQDYFTRRAAIMKRSSIMYSHTFSAAIIVGAIATQAPQCSLATAAIRELDTACAIFKSGKDNVRVARILYIITSLQAKARANFNPKAAVLRNPEPPVNLPGIIGATTVIKQSGRSLDGSSSHSNSPPGDSPPVMYEPQPLHIPAHREVAHQEVLSDEPPEPLTPQYNNQALPAAYWMQSSQPTAMPSAQQTEAPHHTRPHMEVPSHYPNYMPPAPEMYMQPSTIVGGHHHDAYAGGWQQDTRTMMVPSHYAESHQRQHASEAYHSAHIPQYHQYTRQMAHQPHAGIADSHNAAVAPDQNWQIFLGRMGIQ